MDLNKHYESYIIDVKKTYLIPTGEYKEKAKKIDKFLKAFKNQFGYNLLQGSDNFPSDVNINFLIMLDCVNNRSTALHFEKRSGGKYSLEYYYCDDIENKIEI